MALRKRSSEKKNSITRTAFTSFEELPNIGPAMAADFRRIGLNHPTELVGKDPFILYDTLCKKTGTRHDPCVIDVFIAAVRYMEGGRAQPWWAFTKERKETLLNRRH